MKNDKIDFEELLHIHKQLKSEHLEKIDFDILIEQLGNVISLHKKYQQLKAEHQELQENLISKISIMEKATEVVRKKRPNLKVIDNQKQELAKLPAKELISEFVKSETRFHSAFPSTFHFQKKFSNKFKNYSAYK